MKRVLFVRQDNNGDVLLQGPALRAIATSASVTLLCSRHGEAAARCLPGVDEVLVHDAEWIVAQPQRVERNRMHALIDKIAAREFDEAIVSTSFHQSPLPAALLLRMAGVPRIGAISVDYPGSLLDVRHAVDEDDHEVRRALSLVRAMGYELDAGDDERMRLAPLPAQHIAPFDSYVVVHPGATVPARAWFPERNRTLVERLCAHGLNVVVTGGHAERALTAFVAGNRPNAADFGGKTTFFEFAALVRDADAIVCGNTAATHIASAVGTPVVELFPPTIPASRFRPWMVPHVLLGDQTIHCRGCRARVCAVPGQPCLSSVSVDDVMDALDAVLRTRALVPPGFAHASHAREDRVC